jgi:cell division septum initiation protein DivIVA
MSEHPEFRTVLRGYDPEQVRATVDELHTSVVTARRLAADRTIELTKMQDHLHQVQRQLDEATARVTELQARPASAPSASDVGTRIGSILALANEEAEELRSAGREEAQRRIDEADAAVAAMRAAGERDAEQLRSTARAEADRLVTEARRQAADVAAAAARDAEASRAEAQAIVERHQAQADALAAFRAQLDKHAEGLRQAMVRVEQLAQEETALVQRQAKENTERIQRDTENQLAAVDTRRQSITAQLDTVGTVLAELGRAVDLRDDGAPDAGDGTGNSTDQHVGRHAADHTEVLPAVPETGTTPTGQGRHEGAGARR